jgi:hypothetical protein
MRSCLLFLTLLATATQADAAQKVAFPYDATVEVDETYVRSGPGSKYYPTTKLKLGQKVVVHRHDPGGWHMIAPPLGSFSWIQGRYVEKAVDGRGTINTNNVVAWVGSFESDIREIYQQKLAHGDEVQILGEKQLLPASGTGPAELWYRIAPRRGEWRWISGQALSPAPRDSDKTADNPFDRPVEVGSRARATPAVSTANDDHFEKPVSKTTGRNYLDNDGFSPPSNSGGNASGDIVDRPVVRRQGQGPSAKRPEAAVSKRLDTQLDELDGLDARFRAILDKDPLEWDFTELENDYRGLRAEIDSGNVQQMIDVRLARISSYRKTRAEHEEYERVSQETLRRDAELAEIQRRQEAQLTALRQPRYDGAGIVNRSALNRKGAPQYALLAPSGKVLAYLVAAPGVNLDAWLGRSVGVSGSRVPHPDLKADLITVFRLTPVRLAQ